MESYIKFYSQVNQSTAIQLQKIVEQQLLGGMKTLNLLLSTPGGSVHDGISLYNFLKGLPITVNTYNFGSVDSIGVVIFCAGNNRFSVPHARFLLHPVSLQVPAGAVLDEPSISEKLKMLKADEKNIASVISFTTNKKTDDIFNLIHTRTTLDPEEAKNTGLVTEIKSELVPSGANIISIYDSQPQQQAQILQLPMRGATTPMQFSESYFSSSFTSIE